MRGKLATRLRGIVNTASAFNEARALCAGSWARTAGSKPSTPTFNEARALCAGSYAS